MSGFLSREELKRLKPAETAAFASPIPTQVVSSDEFFPARQNQQQRQVEARLKDMGTELARKQGMSRRSFFATAAGMATAFLAMNQVYGKLFDVTPAEAATPEMAEERAAALEEQFIFDGHTHFLRDDTRLTGFIKMRQAVGDAGWNPELRGKKQTIEDLKYNNYFKEIFLDSDTKVALISSAPSDLPRDWFLTNEMMAAARAKVNQAAGSRRLLCHAIFTPGQPGWLDHLDRALALKPDSVKGYTIGDNTHKELAHYPWRMDDEKVTYPGYEKMQKAGIKNVCVHKGLFPPSLDKVFPRLRPYADVSDVAKAAKDWPQLNFVIYHSGYRNVGGGGSDAAEAWAMVVKNGRNEWVTDLAEIPEKHGVTNVYGDLGQLFAVSTVAQPNLAAYLVGCLIQGLGADHVVWGTDALWTGSPQWQIEGLRRLEIPEEMQRRFGFKPLGPADGPVKTAIFSGNSARLYKYQPPAHWLKMDRFAEAKEGYLQSGPRRTNLRYGYVAV
ncbi:MAG TPA: amidohydrolase family protein [Terriglobales bacterium]|nr:amidohydrolase family protein [Terriglobales bacterium]